MEISSGEKPSMVDNATSTKIEDVLLKIEKYVAKNRKNMLLKIECML